MCWYLSGFHHNFEDVITLKLKQVPFENVSKRLLFWFISSKKGAFLLSTSPSQHLIHKSASFVSFRNKATNTFIFLISWNSFIGHLRNIYLENKLIWVYRMILFLILQKNKAFWKRITLFNLFFFPLHLLQKFIMDGREYHKMIY